MKTRAGFLLNLSLTMALAAAAACFARAQEEDTLRAAAGPFATFFAVHMEANELSHGKYQAEQWPNLIKFVETADKYDAKLTLLFNPQWAEFVLQDEKKLAVVKGWQKNGHEVGLHFHWVRHGDWNGYTNRKDGKYTNDPRYRGPVGEMMTLIAKLAEPDKILTMCMGPEPKVDSPGEVEIDETDYPDGILYDLDGMNLGVGKPVKTRFGEKELVHLWHHFFASPRRTEHLDRIREEFTKAGADEVLGVVTHEADFGRDPEFIELWFKFCSEQNVKIKTVRSIIAEYPKDKIAEVKYSPTTE
ncbi:MAG: hypothetical protein RDV41_10430, partial [Planctomycetota bacterium]|nr:hypothetical protein [Planctomycetota bacterium]